MRDRAQDAGAHGGGELHLGLALEALERLRRAQPERSDVDLHEVGVDALEVDRKAGGEPPASELLCVLVVLGEPLTLCSRA